MNSIICVEPQSDLRWQEFVEQRSSSVFHSPSWLQVLATTYNLEVQGYLLVDENGARAAGLPVCRVVDFKRERLVTLPFSDYCDPLVTNMTQWNCLVEELTQCSSPHAIRCLHNSIPLQDARFRQTNRAKWHGLDLRPDLDMLWNQLDSSARRAVRKAQQEGVVVRKAESKQELREFFLMHMGVRKEKYQMLAQPYRFFENIWQQFMEQDRGVLMMALWGNELIAGTLYLEWRDGLYYKFNASLPEHLQRRANDLLAWTGIQYAKERGLTHLDFGLSDWEQEGLIRYKSKYANEEKTISFLRSDRADRVIPDAEQHLRRLLPQLTNLFTDDSVPNGVTEKAGDVLYRYFIE
jgi:CelD/BcsL family acetyltransferase involved in cellulose biosynthesis